MTLDRLKIRQQVQHLSDKELTKFLQQAVEDRQQTLTPEWQQWLLDFSIRRLRPHTMEAKPIDWCRWLAFTLRYISPLVTSPITPPIAVKAVEEVLSQRHELYPTLMFGTYSNVLQTLRVAYHVGPKYHHDLLQLSLTPEQQGFIKQVTLLYELSSERTRSGFSHYYFEFARRGSDAINLTVALRRALQSSEDINIADLISSLRHRRQAVADERAQFQAFLERAMKIPSNAALMSQTLGYVNEFEHRLAVQRGYGKLFVRLCGGTAALLVLLVTMTRLPSTLLTAVLGAIAAIAVILAAMLVVTSGWFIALKLYDDFGWALRLCGHLKS